MKRLSCCITIIAFLVPALAGCDRQSDTIFADHPQRDYIRALGAPIESSITASPVVVTANVINGYLLQFDGRVRDNGRTTFFYTVSGAGAVHSLSNFFLELPACAPALDSFSPPGAVIGLNPLVDIFGIKWEEPLAANESRSYAITFPGDIPLGAIMASVKASDMAELGEIAGPCDGFEISGTVFVDADSNGAMNEAEESGIVDVTVTLVDGSGNELTATTDVNGDYAFIRIAGTYTLRIDPATAADDFNEDLEESFDPTGPTSSTVTVGPDSPGNDFGFDPRAEQITLDLEQGIILTTGETPKFWKKQLRAAISGSMGKTEFDAATMAQFITEIQGLYLPDPFQFTPGNEFQEAMDILSTKSKDPLPQLLRELLAAEFNEVSGKGLEGAPELQSVMISWAEAVAFSASYAASPMTGYSENERPLLGSALETRIATATDFLSRLNGNTGGGSGGGG